ncbi:MAG: PEPxxWA-CTERM sorting domain-containing protein [Sphingomicrobium sp.]
MRQLVLGLMGAAVLALSSGAYASATVSDGTCATSNVSPTATACVGFFTGNTLSNNTTDNATISASLSTLGVSNYTTFSDYATTTVSGLGGLTDLSTLFGNLTGTNVFGIHFGGGAGGGETAFYSIDFGTGSSSFKLNLPNSSSVTLFSGTGAVPEPATWAMMLLGFGAMGVSMRRRRRVTAMQIA